VKRRLKRLVRTYDRAFWTFTPADLQRALVELGVARGDLLMVHSSFNRFRAFTGGPADVVRTLQHAVGPNGTLVLPTTPFQRTAVEYAGGDPVFDARRTASKMGIITEIFRRSPDVVRSMHPTHSVAAWGAKAYMMVAGHEAAETPCGRRTPYGRLLDHDGKLLLAGVPPNTMTFCYFVAEELESRLSVPVLTRETYPLRWRDADGNVRVSHVRLYSPRIDHDLDPLITELKRRRQWRERRVGRLRLFLVRARDVYDVAVDLADTGEFVRERPHHR